ncbi:MFP1 attachment factor 1-like [Melia azedarach]|uniref:MFP1 attachment factor 1-like n=1 Tax=Melia azedarach TaxID=155640 RepID=A0ACC1WUV1_MELAZ|nr:MFP1 attachment factor 1-like [Melia azedarach]
MSDSEIATPSTTPPTDLQAMETETQPETPQNDAQQESKKLNTGNLAFRIWPPTQRTRDAVIARLIETLTTPSVLSKRYGAMPTDEADSAARVIEKEAFSVADAAASAEDDGIEVLQVYSKEISKRMLESVKSRASAAGSASATAVDDNDIGEEPAGGSNEVQTEA